VLRACLQSPLTHPLCLSSCEQHDAFLAAAAVVTAAEAEQREAEEGAAKLARSAACCATQRSVLRFGLPTGYRLWIFDSIRSPLDPQRSSES
jgi:hypothetical protein